MTAMQLNQMRPIGQSADRSWRVITAAAPPSIARTAKGVVTTKGGTLKGGTQVATNKGTRIATQRSQPVSRGSPSRDERPRGSGTGSQAYTFITGFPFPLGPTFTRKTVRKEVEKGSVWIFEQTQALEVFDVYTPVRMTVIKLKSGGLWVHAPVAPTDECIRLLKELNAPVEYIVLPTFAYEHKAFVGPFSRKFPKAKVYVTPYQWSYPLNLPPQFFGIFPAGELRSDDPNVPWADEIEQKLFLPPSIGVGNFVRFTECAFFHKKSRTLLVTDAVVYVNDKPPEVIPRASLLELARDNFLATFITGGRSPEEVKKIAKPQKAEDTEAARRKGWMRMALLVLYFGPGDLLTPEASFNALSNRLMVGPVVETLVYNKVPTTVRAWVDDICASWNFRQVIPCHFAAPVKAGPTEFKNAFAFAYENLPEDEQAPEAAHTEQPKGLLGSLTSIFAPKPVSNKPQRVVTFPEADMKTLNTLNDTLVKLGAVKSNADV